MERSDPDCEVIDVPVKSEWKKSDVFAFIVLIRPHRCLWDTRDTDYTNGLARKKALRSVLTKLNLPRVTERIAWEKLESIRKIYYSELRKVIERGNEYVPKVYWFKVIDVFMREAYLKPNWIKIPNINDNRLKNQGSGLDLTQFAMEGYSTYAELNSQRQRLYKQAVTMILNELHEEQENT